MDRKELQLLGFEIVAYAGDARSSLLTVLKEVREGNFDNVERLLADAD
ncbi:TPA: PTS lactose/cellobiose transporter subunit IIA, partial [Enterococcus faecium]